MENVYSTVTFYYMEILKALLSTDCLSQIVRSDMLSFDKMLKIESG
jgi:hypothetical protein